MSKQLFIIVLVWLVPSLAWSAAPPNEIRYSYIEGYIGGGEVEVFGEDIDAVEYGISGSVAVHPNIALFAAIGGGKLETKEVCDQFNLDCPDLDVKQFAIGINPHFPLGDTVDIVIPVAYQWVELDASGYESEDDSGYSIGLGLRALLTPAFELGVGVQHVDVGGEDGDTQTVGGSIRWHITELFSLAAGIEAGSDSREALLGARFTF